MPLGAPGAVIETLSKWFGCGHTAGNVEPSGSNQSVSSRYFAANQGGILAGKSDF